jgi:riboflavin biosynthesis pyrimidine reductase
VRRLLPDPAELDDAGLIDAYRVPAGRHLRVNFVASLDGAVTVDGRSGGLGSPGDRRVFNLLRALTDVVLVGHGTAAAEGYHAVATDSPVGRLRSGLGRPATMPIAVVSKRASLDPASGLVTHAVSPTILVTCAASDPGRREALAAAGVVVLVCGDDEVDLPLALDRLAALGHEHVLCEGGPTLFRDALAAGVVDELDLSIAPALVGGGHRLLEGLPAALRLDLHQLLEDSGTLFARYAVEAPGAR